MPGIQIPASQFPPSAGGVPADRVSIELRLLRHQRDLALGQDQHPGTQSDRVGYRRCKRQDRHRFHNRHLGRVERCATRCGGIAHDDMVNISISSKPISSKACISFATPSGPSLYITLGKTIDIFIWWSEYRRWRAPVQHNRIEFCIINQFYGHRAPAGPELRPLLELYPDNFTFSRDMLPRHRAERAKRIVSGRHGTSRCQQKHHRGTRLQWSECILPALPAGSGTARTTRVFAHPWRRIYQWILPRHQISKT